MIYLASPYSAAPHHYYNLTVKTAAQLFRTGHLVFSPILHWHDAAQRTGLPTDAEFWWKYNRHMLGLADELWVCCFDGWKHSKGVAVEIDWWKEHCPDQAITYWAPDL